MSFIELGTLDAELGTPGTSAAGVWLPTSLTLQNPASVAVLKIKQQEVTLVMANRVMYVGDTYPAALLQVADETFAADGPLNLSSASNVEVQFIGADFTFSGAGTPIWPAEADPNGTNLWNLSFPFTTGDTAHVDTYQIFVVVTWSTGNVETFPTADTLTVSALPVS